MGIVGYNLLVSTKKSTEDALKQVARIAILTTLILIIPSTLTANASTTRAWEAVNVAGSGLDTLANNAQVTVSFGKAGRYDIGYGNSVGGAFYLTNSECGVVTPSPCVVADIDGTVRFTFGSPQTHIRIHYGYVNSNDPEKVISNLGAVNMTAESSGGNLVSSVGNLLTSQPAGTLTSTGTIEATSGDASGTAELRFAAPGVSFIEFQNDFQAQGQPNANFGQNLVGLSLPVEYAQATFNANSGAGTMSTQSAARTTNLSSNAFTYSGYTFAGWNTAANGSGTAFADGASFPFTADTILYAQWTLIPVATPTPTPTQTPATPAPASSPASITPAVQAPTGVPATLLATTGADASQATLIGGIASLLAIAGLVVFGIRRKLKNKAAD
jgi:uncharacterized repeat protein (TIGR02543 family)